MTAAGQGIERSGAARADVRAVVAVGRRQDHAVAHADRAHRRACRCRCRRRRARCGRARSTASDYLFRRQATFDAMVEGRRTARMGRRVRQSLWHAARAGRGCAGERAKDVLFDIDWQGTQQLREKAGADVVSVFILPPSAADLEKRLHTRAQDSDDVIRGRMDRAGHEMSHWAEYDYIVVNQNVDEAFLKVQSILQGRAAQAQPPADRSHRAFVRSLQRQLREIGGRVRKPLVAVAVARRVASASSAAYVRRAGAVRSGGFQRRHRRARRQIAGARRASRTACSRSRRRPTSAGNDGDQHRQRQRLFGRRKQAALRAAFGRGGRGRRWAWTSALCSACAAGWSAGLAVDRIRPAHRGGWRHHVRIPGREG